MPGPPTGGCADDDGDPSQGGSAHSVPLEVLLAVQDGDTAADQLRHRRARLPERDVLAGLEARLEKNATEAAELDAVRHAQEVRLAELAGRLTSSWVGPPGSTTSCALPGVALVP